MSIILTVLVLSNGVMADDDWVDLKYGIHVLTYNKKTTAEADAKRLGNWLSEKDGPFTEENSHIVALSMNEKTYEIRYKIKKGNEQDADVIAALKKWCKLASKQVFNGADVDVHLCDKEWKTLRVISNR